MIIYPIFGEIIQICLMWMLFLFQTQDTSILFILISVLKFTNTKTCDTISSINNTIVIAFLLVCI